MFVSLDRSPITNDAHQIPTYSVQTVPQAVGITLDTVISDRADVHMVVVVPSVDSDGLDDATTLHDQGSRIHEVTGSRVIVTLPFVRGNLDSDSLHVAEAIRRDMKARGHEPPRSTFLLYLELHPDGDGSTDIVGFARSIAKLDVRTVDTLANAWRKAADELAGKKIAQGEFCRAVHGGGLPSRLEWILAARQLLDVVTTLKKWLSFFSSRS
jgi:hypothetical protein